jgi:hypothetical protein
MMWTLVPTGPLAGSKQQMSGGGGVTVNESLLVPVPNGVVTEIGPLVAPDGTKASISVGEETAKSVVAVPLNVTLVAPVKLVPVMSTKVVPVGPLVGEKELIAGGVVSPTLSTTTSSKFAPMPQ